MKTIFKKTVTIMVMIGLVTSQIGCSTKLHQIRTPLEQAEFPKDYTYTVKLKTQEKIRGVQTEELNHAKNGLDVKTKTETRSLMAKDIEYVYGLANVGTEQNILNGIFIGSAVGLAVGSGVGLLVSAADALGDICFIGEECPTQPKESFWEEYDSWIIPMASGLIIGGLAGAAVGSKPKKRQIIIIPTVAPSENGVSAGANVGVKF